MVCSGSDTFPSCANFESLIVSSCGRDIVETYTSRGATCTLPVQVSRYFNHRAKPKANQPNWPIHPKRPSGSGPHFHVKACKSRVVAEWLGGRREVAEGILVEYPPVPLWPICPRVINAGRARHTGERVSIESSAEPPAPSVLTGWDGVSRSVRIGGRQRPGTRPSGRLNTPAEACPLH